MQEVQKNQKSTLEYLMHYGALLGLFWMFKYLFFIGQTYWVHFIYFFQMLNIVSPLLMYIFYMKYKSETPEIKHNLGRCILFVVGICAFGSIFEGVIQYAHYAFINPDVFANLSAIGVGAVEGTMKMMEEYGFFKEMTSEQVSILNDQYMKMASSKLLYVVSNMISQVFIGFIFSLLIGVLTRNRTPNS